MLSCMQLLDMEDKGDFVGVTQISQAVLRKHGKVLAEKNVVRYLLSKALLKAFWKLEESAKGVKIADVVLKSVELYESSRGVQEVLSMISVCHYRVGNWKIGGEKAMKLYPTKIRPEDIAKSVAEAQGIPYVKTSNKELHLYGSKTIQMDSGKVDVSKLFS